MAPTFTGGDTMEPWLKVVLGLLGFCVLFTTGVCIFVARGGGRAKDR
jgi:hypothetical protein